MAGLAVAYNFETCGTHFFASPTNHLNITQGVLKKLEQWMGRGLHAAVMDFNMLHSRLIKHCTHLLLVDGAQDSGHDYQVVYQNAATAFLESKHMQVLVTSGFSPEVAAANFSACALAKLICFPMEDVWCAGQQRKLFFWLKKNQTQCTYTHTHIYTHIYGFYYLYRHE